MVTGVVSFQRTFINIQEYKKYKSNCIGTPLKTYQNVGTYIQNILRKFRKDTGLYKN